MMRLYRIDRRSQPGSCWAGTQDDAKRIARELGTGFSLVEVPTDKTGLLEFLNFEGKVATETGSLNSELALAPSQPAPAPQPAFTRKPAPSTDAGAEAIADWLESEATSGEVYDVFCALSHRFSDAAKAVRS